MNPNESLTPGEELEIRITALLMGELTPDESNALRAQLADNPELQSLHNCLARAFDLLRAATPLCETIDPAAPVRLSTERRERLLQQFKTAKTVSKAQSKVVPIVRPRWTWLAPLSWAASFAIVIGFLVWQAEQHLSPMASMGTDSESSVRLAYLEGKVSNHRFFASNGLDGAHSVDSDAIAPQAMAGEEVATSSRGDVSTLAAIVPPPAAAKPVPSSAPVFAGGGIAGDAPTSTPSAALPEAPAMDWAEQPGAVRVITKSGRKAELSISSATGAVPAPTAIPALPPEDSIAAADAKTKAKVTSGTSALADGEAKTEHFATALTAKANTATEGTFWDTAAVGQAATPATPAKPASGPAAENSGGLIANSSISDRRSSRFGEAAVAEVNKQLAAQLDESKQVADSLKTQNEELKRSMESIERGMEQLKMAIPGDPAGGRVSRGGAPDTNSPASSTAAGLPGMLASGGGGALQGAQRPASPNLTLNEIPVVEPNITAESFTTAGRVQMQRGLNAPVLGDTPILGRVFSTPQETGAAKEGAKKGDKLSEPQKPAAADAFGAIAGLGLEKTETARDKSVEQKGRAEASVSGTLNFAGRTLDMNGGVADLQSEFTTESDGKDSLAIDALVFDERRTKDVADTAPYYRGRSMDESGQTLFKNRAVAPKGGSSPESSKTADQLLRDAEGFSDTGRFDLAKKRYDEVLKSDPNNTEAREGQEKIDERRQQYAESASNETRSRQLWLLEAKRANPVRKLSPEAESLADSATPDQQNWYFKQDGTLAKLGKTVQPATPAQQPATESLERLEEKPIAQSKEVDAPTAAPKAPAPVPQPEIATNSNAFSTFSLNVSDVAFKLAAASLEQDKMPDPAAIRSEEFINAFDYRDPEPVAGAPLAFATERAQYPFAQNRDILRLSIKTAAVGRQQGRPLNLVLLVDNSGSMERADRVRILRESLRVLAAQLQPQDKLSIITFARTPHLVVDGTSGDQAAEAAGRVSGITPQGGTNLSSALDLAYETARRHYQVANINRVVLLTDGAANLGDVNPSALKQKVETQRKQGIALDCFGVGWEGFNDDLLEQLSRNGDGRYGFINSADDAAKEFAAQLAGALRVAASDVKVQVEFNPKRVTAYRQIGYAKHQLTKEQFRDNTVDAAEIGAAESGNALYAVEVNPRGEGDLAVVRARFKVPGTSDYREQEWTVPFTPSTPALEHASPGLRLAATASAFSELLAGSPYASEVTSDRLLGFINGVPQTFGTDPRPQKLEWMIRQAKSLSGK